MKAPHQPPLILDQHQTGWLDSIIRAKATHLQTTIQKMHQHKNIHGLKTKTKNSTFVQNVPEGDPVPGHRDVPDLHLGLQQSHTLQVILLYTERRGICEGERK